MSPQLNEREASDKSLQGEEMVGGFYDRGLVGGQVGATATKEREDGGQGGVFIDGGRREAIVELAMERCQSRDRIQIDRRFQLKGVGLMKGN